MNSPGRKIVLLDLDGTLTASDPGIIGCVRYIFTELNEPMPSEAALRGFIGPSIAHSLRVNGVKEEFIDQGIAIYRKYYNDLPVFDDPNHPGRKVVGRLCSEIYPGIPQQLTKLRSLGYHLSVASCKPEYQAKSVCEYFGLQEYLDDIFGASQDGSRTNKDQVIQYGFDRLAFNPNRGDRALMVGDRWTDVDGAQAEGIDCLGCGWGYAEPDELLSHGAYRVIDEISQLADAIKEYFASHE